MVKLEYNGSYYDLLDTYSINKSSRQVTYNNVKIDFTNKTLSDIPNKYQECHLVSYDEVEQNGIILNKILGDDIKTQPVTSKNICSGLESGYYNTSTGAKISGSFYRNANPILVEPNTTYKFSINGVNKAINVLEYKEDMTYIGQIGGASIPAPNSFTTSSEAKYINIFRGTGDGNEKWQIEKGSTATEYVAYIDSPSPDYPQSIETVTGEQTIALLSSDGQQSRTFRINLGNIELCKIGNYQDYIYKDNNKWYLHKEINKVVLDGSETYYVNNTGTANWFYRIMYTTDIASGSSGISNYYNYTNISNSNTEQGIGATSGHFRVRYGTEDTPTNFKNWVTNHNIIIYYPLSNPITTEITDTTLIEQLENINNSYVSYNANVSTTLLIEYTRKEIINKINEKNIYTGYVNTIILPNMKNKIEYRELEIELLSPMALATRRTITAIGNYNLKSLIELILQPLYNDGFTLKEFNVGNADLTVNYLIETVESALNKLSNKYNFWWYIDENKNIYINSIDYQFAQNPKLTYNEDSQLNGLISLTPSIDATDYCNVVNFNNVRTWQYSYYGDFIYNVYDGGQIIYTKTYTLEKDKLINVDSIKNEDEVTFEHPVDITVENIIKSNKSNFNHRAFTDYQNYALLINYKYNDNSTGQVYIRLNNNTLQISNNATLEETPSTTKEFEFKRDGFFKNLITGFKYNNGSKSITSIQLVFSCSALMWTKLKINDLSEIQNSKGKISTSGQIEKIVNMNEQWKTLDELQEIGNAYIKTNSSQSDKIEMIFDVNYDFKIGDIINIQRPSFLISGTYIITDIVINYVNTKYNKYKIALRNSNYFENYVDLFRATETEEVEEKNYNLSTIDYEEGTIKEVHEVV